MCSRSAQVVCSEKTIASWRCLALDDVCNVCKGSLRISIAAASFKQYTEHSTSLVLATGRVLLLLTIPLFGFNLSVYEYVSSIFV